MTGKSSRRERPKRRKRRRSTLSKAERRILAAWLLRLALFKGAPF
jgi:hypothetical protein